MKGIILAGGSGTGLIDVLKRAKDRKEGATIFGHHVSDPIECGIVGFGETNGYFLYII